MKTHQPPNPTMHPESLMMRHGYDPTLASHSVKPPIYMTSTFSFPSAEVGKAYGEVINNLRPQQPDEDFSNTYIYSRETNPNLEILERRLCVWDGAEDCAVFESGMAAIGFTLLQFLSPGDVLLHGEPSYGCTDYFTKRILTRFGIRPVGFRLLDGEAGIAAALRDPAVAAHLKMIYIETPCNPSNAMADIGYCAQVARAHSTADRQVLLAVDNTFLGPLFQRPLAHGADLVLYSATKYIGGHSDVIAGACLGRAELIGQVKLMRGMLGGMPSPHTAWLLTRSLETLKLRMTASMEGARRVADFLADHPKVERVYYLGHLRDDDPQFAIYRKQCLAPGGMISFDVRGGEEQAFRFLNALRLFHLAVSLGGNESLAEHPATLTHAEVDLEDRLDGGITSSMIRLSIGIEHPEDLIADLRQALDAVL
ncbi:MAG TPA: PLP-dependent transferase [Kouleothrix sp.]|uniref:PLP-dependent transferase n=1 Tax=Kouleothrix sp. TaxID=2779161 RepID=UPI002BF37624|nr:PLP-dependent transferase [Kouleothrix sp.]HRC77574.1 PLP-dependent transferase [Kouleothrix sp.]